MNLGESVDQEAIEKAEYVQRRARAQLPFEVKLQMVVQLQNQNYESEKSAGRRAPRPWSMSREQYEQEMRELDEGG